jgi:hypothetical protein
MSPSEIYDSIFGTFTILEGERSDTDSEDEDLIPSEPIIIYHSTIQAVNDIIVNGHDFNHMSDNEYNSEDDNEYNSEDDIPI